MAQMNTYSHGRTRNRWKGDSTFLSWYIQIEEFDRIWGSGNGENRVGGGDAYD